MATKQYRYINDLMENDEKLEYEQSVAKKKAAHSSYSKNKYNQEISKIIEEKQKAALRRGKVWELSEDFIMKYLWNQPCVYCGREIKTLAIDRIDSKSGYIPTNVQPCCSACNCWKMGRSHEEMMENIMAVVSYWVGERCRPIWNYGPNADFKFRVSPDIKKIICKLMKSQ